MNKTNLTTTTNLKPLQKQKPIPVQDIQFFVKLIQMNTVELNNYIEDQLAENPTLEESNENEKQQSDNEFGETFLSDAGSSFNDHRDDLLSIFSKIEEIEKVEGYLTNNYNDELPHSPDLFTDTAEEETSWESTVSKSQSLYEYINWQLDVSDLTGHERKIARLIIGNINEDGYLETSIDDLIIGYITSQVIRKDQKGASDHITKEDILSVLNKIQTTFDPTGIGSTSLEECLKIQARQLGYTDTSPMIRIIDEHLEELSREQYEKVSESLSVEVTEIKKLHKVISSLESKPGRPFYAKDAQKSIVPEFFLYKIKDDFQIQFNKTFPKLRISSYYRNLLRDQKDLNPDTQRYIKEKLEGARRFLKCFEERERVLRKVVERITETQKEYFEHEGEHLKPLKLKDVAESAGIHVSTVSRITRNRYIQTPRGIFELKMLFSRGVDTSAGDKVSSEKVKSIIKELISNENPANPFSDNYISEALESRNIKVSRRTVAKYRTVLKIPSSSKRTKKREV